MLKMRTWLLMAAIFLLIIPVSATFDITAQGGYPVLLNGSSAVEIETNVLVADIIGDSKDEIIVSAHNGRVYVFNTSGTKLWDTQVDAHAVFSSSPAAGNVIGGAGNEVVVGSGFQASNELSVIYGNGSFVAGWPKSMGDIYSSPVLYNMDSDAYLEIIVGSDDKNLYVLNADGSNVAGWPNATGGAIWSKPAIGDIDGDGEIEIIATSMDGKVYAWNKDGTTVAGWPVNPDGVFKRNEPAIGDINGDGVDDVVVFTSDTKKLVGINGSGSVLFSYQVIASEVEAAFSSPSIGDANGDGDLEIIVGVEDGRVYAYDQNGLMWSYAAGGVRSKPLFADITNDGVAEIIVSAKNGNLYAFYGSGILAWSNPSGSCLWSSPSVSDIDNDGILEVVVGEWDSVAADLYAWKIGFTPVAPTVSITSPSNSAVYQPGDSVSFTSSVTDVNGIRSQSWSSNRDGILSTSKDFTKSDLSIGTHTITLTGVNLDGTPAIDTVGIRINTPPAVTIISPSDKSVFDEGNTINFAGTAVDLDGTISSYKWISDIDGVINISSTFAVSSLSGGIHVLTFTAIDNDGASRSAQIMVRVKGASGNAGPVSGGGGGGGGGSSEDPDNIYFYETVVNYISAGKIVIYKFQGEENVINKVEFLSKTTASGIATHIEVLNHTSSYVSSFVPGIVYKNVNIWVGSSGFATPERIVDATITFRVNKSWMSEFDIDENSITLCRYNDSMWNILPTEKIGDDGQYVYYVSKTPGFSPFAITSISEAERVLLASSGDINGNNIGIVGENGIDLSQNIQEGVTGAGNGENANPSESKLYLPMPGFVFNFTTMIILFVLLRVYKDRRG